VLEGPGPRPRAYGRPHLDGAPAVGAPEPAAPTWRRIHAGMACLGTRRLGFVDVARALAMLLMVNGRVCDALLSEAARQSEPVTHYWLVRAFTAPLFLLISGFVFVIASDGRWEEYGRPSAWLLRRVRRATVLNLIGYLLQVPRWSGAAPFDFYASEWRSLFRTGVL